MVRNFFGGKVQERERGGDVIPSSNEVEMIRSGQFGAGLPAAKPAIDIRNAKYRVNQQFYDAIEFVLVARLVNL